MWSMRANLRCPRPAPRSGDRATARRRHGNARDPSRGSSPRQGRGAAGRIGRACLRRSQEADPRARERQRILLTGLQTAKLTVPSDCKSQLLWTASGTSAARRRRHGPCSPPIHDRRRPGAFHRRILRRLVGLRALLRRPGRRAMTFEMALALGLSVLLTVYLVYALIGPERF